MKMPSIIDDLVESGRSFADKADYENAIMFFRLAIQKLENDTREESFSPENTTEWHIGFYDINLRLGSALILQKEYGQAEGLFLPLMGVLQKAIVNIAIPMLQRAPLVRLYKGYFYALVCLYGEWGKSEKIEQYVAANTAELSRWFINLTGMDKGEQLN